ncbi:MAG: chemotaxis response regulator [Osedax symbiont Rs1]|nr:MAG: chemotaxis response regulator [Osedax symbiont Rs1]
MASLLIVDDSVSVRTMLNQLLTQAGHIIDEAGDGEEALEKAQLTNYDLILTDVNMPLLDGIELCRELRQMQNFRFTPILIITTESADKIKQKGKLAGATGWLIKPFDPDKLVKTVNLLCGKSA